MALSYYEIELRKKEVLYTALREHKKSGEPLELIIGTDRKDDVARNLERIGTVSHYFRLIPYVAVSCSPEDASLIVNQVHGKKYADFKDVRAVELSNQITLPAPRSRQVPSRANYWHLEAIGAYKARQIAKGNARVGIIDTGAEFSHPEIEGNFGKEKGYNFVNPGKEPIDDNGHGTHVAGLIAGFSCGVANSAELYALKILDKNGSGSEANAIAAIEWAALNNLDLVNMSFGAGAGSSAYQRIINVVTQRGVTLVAAAGNSGGYYASFPAAFENVIAVAAVDENLEHADFSNIYPTNDIAAPGVNITSAFLGRSYAVLDGTSMATPLVTGSLALIKENRDLEEILKKTASRLQFDGEYEDSEVFGAGLVRADILAEKYSQNRLVSLAWRLLW